jgi:Mg2+ and Co2+ transporter CorA
MVHQDHLLLVLHAPPDVDQDERRGRFFWRQPDGTWLSDSLGGGLGAVVKHIDEFEAKLDVLDKQEEQTTSSEGYFRVLDTLAPLQRAIRNLHNVLQEARKLSPSARELIDLRDRAYGLERTAELLFTGAKNGLDFQMAVRSERQAETSEQMASAAHRLNVLAAFFFPLATLSAVFGMDIPNGLESLRSPSLFFAVIIVGLILGAGLTLLLRLPRKKQSTNPRQTGSTVR